MFLQKLSSQFFKKAKPKTLKGWQEHLSKLDALPEIFSLSDQSIKHVTRFVFKNLEQVHRHETEFFPGSTEKGLAPIKVIGIFCNYKKDRRIKIVYIPARCPTLRVCIEGFSSEEWSHVETLLHKLIEKAQKPPVET